jgi:hypothetical protein
MIAISMAGKFPRLPLLRNPKNWTEWFWVSLCLIPVLFVLIYGFELSSGMIVLVFMCAQLSSAWRIWRDDAETRKDNFDND